MTNIETIYLIAVIAAFGAFAVALAWNEAAWRKHRGK